MDFGLNEGNKNISSSIQFPVSNLDDNEEILSRVSLTYDVLIWFKLGWFKRVRDRLSLPFIQTR